MTSSVKRDDYGNVTGKSSLVTGKNKMSHGSGELFFGAARAMLRDITGDSMDGISLASN
jgi:hypothetical protein